MKPTSGHNPHKRKLFVTFIIVPLVLLIGLGFSAFTSDPSLAASAADVDLDSFNLEEVQGGIQAENASQSNTLPADGWERAFLQSSAMGEPTPTPTDTPTPAPPTWTPSPTDTPTPIPPTPTPTDTPTPVPPTPTDTPVPPTPTDTPVPPTPTDTPVPPTPTNTPVPPTPTNTPTPLEVCYQLIDVAEQNLAASTITGKNAAKDKAKLERKLDEAVDKLDAGAYDSAIGKLTGFRGKVIGLNYDGKISDAEANQLVADADAAINCISALISP